MQIDETTVAVVTGGASGLGRAAAEALSGAGVRVAVFDVNGDGGEAVARAIGGVFHHVDVTSEDSVVEGFAAVRAAQGQERICVHCAQVSKNAPTLFLDRKTGAYRRFSTADYAFSAEGVLVSSYRVASLSALGMAALDPLEDGERGSIVLTGSVVAEEPQVGQIAYGSLKAGVNGLALPMARDLMDLGIRVNSVMPGLFATPAAAMLKEMAPLVYQSIAGAIAFPKRPGRPAEFGSFVLELVRNSYFNGQALRLDGAVRIPAR